MRVRWNYLVESMGVFQKLYTANFTNTKWLSLGIAMVSSAFGRINETVKSKIPVSLKQEGYKPMYPVLSACTDGLETFSLNSKIKQKLVLLSEQWNGFLFSISKRAFQKWIPPTNRSNRHHRKNRIIEVATGRSNLKKTRQYVDKYNYGWWPEDIKILTIRLF